MGEGYVLVDHICFQIFRLMTSLLEAGRVTDLCVGLAGFLSGDEVGERNLPVNPLSLQMIEEPRLIMALGACHMTVAGDSPGFDIRRHLMADATESGGL